MVAAGLVAVEVGLDSVAPHWDPVAVLDLVEDRWPEDLGRFEVGLVLEVDRVEVAVVVAEAELGLAVAAAAAGLAELAAVAVVELVAAVELAEPAAVAAAAGLVAWLVVVTDAEGSSVLVGLGSGLAYGPEWHVVVPVVGPSAVELPTLPTRRLC